MDSLIGSLVVWIGKCATRVVPRLRFRRCPSCTRFRLIPTGDNLYDEGRPQPTYHCAGCDADYVAARGEGYVARADWDQGVREAFPRAQLHV